MEVEQFPVHDSVEFDNVFAAMTASRVGALLLVDDGGVVITHAEPLAKLALRYQLPSAGFVEFANAGGLLAYGIDGPDQFRRAATFVDKISQGSEARRVASRTADPVQDRP